MMYQVIVTFKRDYTGAVLDAPVSFIGKKESSIKAVALAMHACSIYQRIAPVELSRHLQEINEPVEFENNNVHIAIEIINEQPFKPFFL